MFAQIDEMTDDPASVEVVSGNRIRIAYGRSIVFSLDITEAVDLTDALAAALADISGIPEKGVRRADTLARDEDRVRADAEIREAL